MLVAHKLPVLVYTFHFHGKLGEYMKDHAGVTIQPYHVLYPIPQAAVDANDAITENNEGY